MSCPDMKYKTLYEGINALPSQMRQIVVDYYGFADETSPCVGSLQHCAKRHGVTVEQVEQALSDAHVLIKQRVTGAAKGYRALLEAIFNDEI